MSQSLTQAILASRIIQKQKSRHQQVQAAVDLVEATRSIAEHHSQRRRSHRRVLNDDVPVMKLRVVGSEAAFQAAGRGSSRGADRTSTVVMVPRYSAGGRKMTLKGKELERLEGPDNDQVKQRFGQAPRADF
ncbi:hypothetical protein FS837_001880 [Tulasnella sp. UAMH 9824]|nr:hypothetical protein FS837_001880 [Tulasnella sp. UAMH 9824]